MNKPQIPTPEFIQALQPYELEYMSSNKRFNVLMWHRGAKKTSKLLNKLLIQSNLKKGLYWYIAPYLKQAKANAWTDPNTNIFRWIPDEYKTMFKVNNSELSILMPNGSLIQLHGADKPDALRGPKPLGIVCDEYGEIAKRWGSELREAILEPSVRSSGGWIDYAGTPKGHNDFSLIGGYGGRADWFVTKKTVEDTAVYTPEVIMDIRTSATNQDFFEQEYFCSVMEGASSVFKGIRDCIKGELQKPISGHRYVIGVDLARSFDRTVIVVFDMNTNHLVHYETMVGQPWDFQKAAIKRNMSSYNDATAVIDSTGIGDSFVELLVAEGLSIIGFKISGNTVKRNLIERLQTYIQNKYISYPDIEEVLDELGSYEYEVTSQNLVTYNAPTGKHDDIVIAIALAVQQLSMTPEKYVPEHEYQWVIEEMKVDKRTGYLL